MEVDRSIRKADRIVVFAMVMVLVGCGAIGIATGGSPFDASEWPTVSTPDMATPPDYADNGKLVAKAATADWSADDSAQGTRPDAAH